MTVTRKGKPSARENRDLAGDATEELSRWTRRRVLTLGVGAGLLGIAAAASAVELVHDGVLPGAQVLDELTGACSLPVSPYGQISTGPLVSGRFFSKMRNREVGYTIAYPPNSHPYDSLPLILVLHGYGDNHRNAFTSLHLQDALAYVVTKENRPPFALVAADGGNGYWHPARGGNPQGMLIRELLPLCQSFGLGKQGAVAGYGWSMGGYGALLLGEQYPSLLRGIAAASPAIWTSYHQAHAANTQAFESRAQFYADDVVTHASKLAGIPVLVRCGASDPFLSGVQAVKHALDRVDRNAAVRVSKGCHDAAFWQATSSEMLSFLASSLAAPGH